METQILVEIHGNFVYRPFPQVEEHEVEITIYESDPMGIDTRTKAHGLYLFSPNYSLKEALEDIADSLTKHSLSGF